MPTYGCTYHVNGASVALRITAPTSGDALQDASRRLGVDEHLPTHAQGGVWRHGACLQWRNGADRYGIALVELGKLEALPVDPANDLTHKLPVRRRGKHA